MNEKEITNFAQLQELTINMLIRISALEQVLKNANVLDVDKYNVELTKLATIVTNKIETVFNEFKTTADKSKSDDAITSSEDAESLEQN